MEAGDRAREGGCSCVVVADACDRGQTGERFECAALVAELLAQCDALHELGLGLLKVAGAQVDEREVADGERNVA